MNGYYECTLSRGNKQDLILRACSLLTVDVLTTDLLTIAAKGTCKTMCAATGEVVASISKAFDKVLCASVCVLFIASFPC